MEIVVATAVLVLIDIAFILLRKYLYQLHTDKKYGKPVWGEVKMWKCLYGRPTQYLIKAEYENEEVKQTKNFISCSRAAAKYEKEKRIKIIIMGERNKVYLEEDGWKGQNIMLLVVITVISIVLLPLLFVSFIEISLWLRSF